MVYISESHVEYEHAVSTFVGVDEPVLLMYHGKAGFYFFTDSRVPYAVRPCVCTRLLPEMTGEVNDGVLGQES